MPLREAIGQLEARLVQRASAGRGARLVWSIADVAATRVVLRELIRLQELQRQRP